MGGRRAEGSIAWSVADDVSQHTHSSHTRRASMGGGQQGAALTGGRRVAAPLASWLPRPDSRAAAPAGWGHPRAAAQRPAPAPACQGGLAAGLWGAQGQREIAGASAVLPGWLDVHAVAARSFVLLLCRRQAGAVGLGGNPRQLAHPSAAGPWRRPPPPALQARRRQPPRAALGSGTEPSPARVAWSVHGCAVCQLGGTR